MSKNKKPHKMGDGLGASKSGKRAAMTVHLPATATRPPGPLFPWQLWERIAATAGRLAAVYRQSGRAGELWGDVLREARRLHADLACCRAVGPHSDQRGHVEAERATIAGLGLLGADGLGLLGASANEPQPVSPALPADFDSFARDAAAVAELTRPRFDQWGDAGQGGPAAEATPTADATLWRPAAELYPGRFTTFKAFRGWLARHPEIRTRKPSRQRLEIHAGDWLAFWATEDQKAFDALDATPEAIAAVEEVERRKTEARAAKSRAKKRPNPGQ
jgi:hypothetical protein